MLTERYFLAGVWRNGECYHGESGQHETRSDYIHYIIQLSSSQLDIKCEVNVRVGTACVLLHITNSGET